MFSAILILALISFHCVVCPPTPLPSTSDMELDPDDYPEITVPEESPVVIETTTRDLPHYEDDWFDKNRFPFSIDYTWTGTPPNPLDYPAEQKDESSKGGADGAFYFYLFVCIIASIGLAVFGAYIVFDLTKQQKMQSEQREQYVKDKQKELDNVGMDKAGTVNQANPDSKSSEVTPGASNSVRSDEHKSPRSSIGDQSSTKDSAKSSKTTSKLSPKGSKTASKSFKPKIGPSKNEPSKKTLSNV